MKPLDDAKFSGTKDVDERLKIDSTNLQPWIDEYVPNAGKIKAIEQFKGGQSNPTYKIITESKNLVLRRKPPGKLLPSAHAVDREYKVITALYETDVPVPKTYGLCEDDDVAGTAFFVMDFLDGDLFWDPMIPSMTNRVLSLFVIEGIIGSQKRSPSRKYITKKAVPATSSSSQSQ